ncbi:hypothetical protein TNCV_4206631 [Trichonephila clavipes]|nr:hypothetical protein TNCV_4206631 [Trichonephila clavipes]
MRNTTSFINPVLGLQRVPNVNKMSDHPELLKQMALEVVAGIGTKLRTTLRRRLQAMLWIRKPYGPYID